MPDEQAQPGEHGQKQCQTINQTNRDRTTSGNPAMASGGSTRLGRECIPLTVDEMGICNDRMRDDRAEAVFRRSGQIIAPCGRRDLLPINELPFDLKTLALGGVHVWLPPDMHPCAGGTVQAAGREW